jgi:integrase
MPIPTATQTNPTGWPSALWEDTWENFAITNAGQAAGYTRDQLAVVRHMAWWMVTQYPEDGLDDPRLVERLPHLQHYLNEQKAYRTGSGILGVFKIVKVWFRFVAGSLKGCDECLDREAYRSHSCRHTPVHGIIRPKPSQHKSKVVPVLDDDQWAKVLAAAGDGKTLRSARDLALVNLLGDSGLRRAEAQQLNLSDIDLDAGTVLVQHGKGGKRRLSEFGPDTAKALNRYLRMRKPAGATLKTWLASNPDEPLWIAVRGGQRLSYTEVGKIMQRLGDAAGIPLHAHMTRHRWADGHYRNGTPLDALMTAGGWSGRIPATYGAGAAEQRAIAVLKEARARRAGR